MDLTRELQQILEYVERGNFVKVMIKKNINNKNAVSNHFADVGKKIDMPKGAKKKYLKCILQPYFI